MFGIRLSPTVTRERLPDFVLYFLAFTKLPSLIIQGETPQSMRSYACCPGLRERLPIFLWLKRATSIATSMFLRTWGKDPYRAIIPGQTHYPVFCSILKQINDNHQYPADPFGALADFNIILEEARRRIVRELSRETPDSLGAKLLTASTA